MENVRRVQTVYNTSPPPLDSELESLRNVAKDDSQIRKIRSKKRRSHLPRDEFIYLPSDFQRISSIYHLKDFQRDYCECDIFGESEPTFPVLSCTKRSLVKICGQTMKIVRGCRETLKDVEHLVQIMKNNADIVDEVFVQILMQTLQSKTQSIWKLFLIVCSLFAPSDKTIAKYIAVYFQRNASGDVAELAQLCYIRLLCVTDITKNVMSIPEEALSGKLKFGVTITEQMFGQRNTYPKLPIPFTLHRIISLLQKGGCEKFEGLFRLPGNKKVIDDVADKLNDGVDEIEASNLSVHDLASLLKKWIRELPNPIVSNETINALELDSNSNSFVEFTELLTRANQTSLMYIIGFLQSLIPHSNSTKMDPKNYAICIGPAIVRLPNGSSPQMISKFTDITVNFIVSLIYEWDTSPIFPLDESLLN